MADETISLELFIEADKANLSLGELEQGFDAMKEKLKGVGRGSKEFKELSSAMAGTTKEIKNIELGFEGLDNEQVASELGSVAGAATDVAASFVLMSGGNKTMEEMAAGIETAMAMSMGLKGAIEGVSSGMKLYNNLVKQGKVATIAKAVADKAAAAGTWLLNAANKALNTTLKMNPIGLIVTALGLAVAAIVYFKDSIWGLIKTALAPFQFAIDAVVDALQWLGIMESDSAIATIKAEEEKAAAVKKASEEKIKEYGKQITELKRLQKAHKELSDEVIGDMEFEVKMLKAKGENTVKAEWDLLKEKKRLSNENHKLIFAELQAAVAADKETVKMNGEVLVSERDKVRELLKLNKEAADKTKKAEQEIELFKATHNKGVQDRIDKEADEAAAKSKERWDKGAADRAMARAKESQAKKDALMEDIVIVKKDIAFNTERLDRNTITIEGLKSNEEILHDSKIFWHNKDLERIAEENAARREASQIALDLAGSTLTEISGVSNAFADRDAKAEDDRLKTLFATTKMTEKQKAAEELKSAKIKDAIRKKQFENEKKMQIAMAAINGAQALVSIFAQYPKFDGGFAMIAALVAAGVTTAASIAKIKSTSFTGSASSALPTLPDAPVEPDGAGAGSGGTNINPVSNTSTILGNQQVFVTETDITDTQNNVSVIEESATF